MKSWILCAWLLPCCALFGQQPSEKIAFEVASIKPAQPSPMGQVRIEMSADDGMLRYSNVSLKDCIRTAYRVKEFQVEGPDWIGGARFDIAAKLPAGSSKKQVPEMLQALLADRFHLILHRETKDHAIWALVAEKGGATLKPAEVQPGAESGRGGQPRGQTSMQVQDAGGGVHLNASAATLSNLAEMISRFTERPVVDMTGIQGVYDFDLVFSPETTRGMRVMGGGMPPPGAGEHAPSDAPEGAGSIYDSVARYGLNLEARKAPMEILIVDHIDRTPTEN
ncbi:MAG: TIGR03435 family protein [Bryobacteraceae bacterium]